MVASCRPLGVPAEGAGKMATRQAARPARYGELGFGPVLMTNYSYKVVDLSGIDAMLKDILPPEYWEYSARPAKK